MIIPILVSSYPAFSAEDHPYTLKYRHDYKVDSRKNKDKIRLTRDFGHGLSLGVEEAFEPRKEHDGSPGNAFSHPKPRETKVILGWKTALSDRVSFKPALEFKKKHQQYVYEPKFKLPVKMTDNLTLKPGYKLKYTHYSVDGKNNKRKHEWQLGLSYKIDDWKFGLQSEYIRSNKAIYNDGRSDYKNKLSVDYAFTKYLTPFVQIRDVSIDSHKSGRQAQVRGGFKYKF